MSEVAEITVAYNNPPKEGKKWGNIKGSDGSIYFAPPAVLSQFQSGKTYRLEWEPFGDGGTGKKIKRKIESPHASVPKQNIRPATNPADSDRMATMGMVNNFIACGHVALDPEAIARAINTCSAGLHRSSLHGAQVQRRDDLDDEIPC